jgi:hypothetical protein
LTHRQRFDYLRLFQHFSFWNSYLEFRGKTGPLPVFPRVCSETNGFWNKLTCLSEFLATKANKAQREGKMKGNPPMFHSFFAFVVNFLLFVGQVEGGRGGRRKPPDPPPAPQAAGRRQEAGGRLPPHKKRRDNDGKDVGGEGL